MQRSFPTALVPFSCVPMAPFVIDVRRADDQRDVVHRAVQALAEGGLVAFPTETVYGVAASALNDAAVTKLLSVARPPADEPLALVLKSLEEALDYVPTLPPLAERLARRCWPGPITLALTDSHEASLIRQLPAVTHQAVVPAGTIRLRVPAHDLIRHVLEMTAGPLVIASTPRTGPGDATTAQDVLAAFGRQVDLVLDDGPSKYGQPPSVVQMSNDSYSLLQAGVVTDTHLRQLMKLIVLFVCTGNTCRSPMAEMLMKKRLAERLNCGVGELEERGILVASAGLAASGAGRASPAAVEVIRGRGLDLGQHESQPLSERLVRFADLILTMTRGHRDSILQHWPDAAARLRLVCHDQRDVSDPIGGPLEMYVHCADQIDGNLRQWAAQIDTARLLWLADTGD